MKCVSWNITIDSAEKESVYENRLMCETIWANTRLFAKCKCATIKFTNINIVYIHYNCNWQTCGSKSTSLPSMNNEHGFYFDTLKSFAHEANENETSKDKN